MSLSGPIGTPEDNERSPLFDEKFDELVSNFFGRDPEKWPIFAEPSVRKYLDSMIHAACPDLPDSAVPNGENVKADITSCSVMPESPMSSPDDLARLKDDVNTIATMSKNWYSPAAVENVMAMPSDPAIHGCVMALCSNPNIVHYEYAKASADIEDTVARMMGTQVGWDPAKVQGIFSSGGTMCNLYGYLAGLRTAFPDSVHHGFGAQDYRFMHAFSGHYSNVTCLSTLGVDIVDRAITVKNTVNNETDYDDLEKELDACLRMRIKVPTILVTFGTTDTFAVDDVQRVAEIRDRVVARYQPDDPTWRPHIHADSAVGWPLVFFRGYDREKNPLGFTQHMLQVLEEHQNVIEGLKYADSVTIDLHKWGYVPYSASMVLFKNKAIVNRLSNDPDNFTYFNADPSGHTVFHSTIECSRGAVGIYGAYTALKALGKEGYQMLTAHGIQNANYLRHALRERVPGAVIVGSHNGGPSVCWRLYDTDDHKEAKAKFKAETGTGIAARPPRGDRGASMAAIPAGQKRRSLIVLDSEATTSYHNAVYKHMCRGLSDPATQGKGMRDGKVGTLSTDWIQHCCRGSFDVYAHAMKFPGQKAVFFNPWTNQESIDGFVDDLVEAIAAVRKQRQREEFKLLYLS
eukprot:CAMPEP_0197433236 /NCGR_PEP_ID=MMETSP1175-20131217/1165_1 /TAXON_ID=1003142 /ORGANISM="Triceratium dubium, Strain CCMP147" /LENGTH=630 /DNA_ID=CAMNT_0042961555 /DNA_START=179 /DNA_END=2071 /DNA_ORIENTATION=-